MNLDRRGDGGELEGPREGKIWSRNIVWENTFSTIEKIWGKEMIFEICIISEQRWEKTASKSAN